MGRFVSATNVVASQRLRRIPHPQRVWYPVRRNVWGSLMTDKNISRGVSTLLIVSAVLLGILVPGGPIETRDFSHISPVILGIFNTFLTGLGIGSFVFAYIALKGKRWAFIVSFVCGISYFLVYTLDLFKIFPVSPNEMPAALLVIETVGILVSIPLAYLSLRAIQMPMEPTFSHEANTVMNKKHVLILAVMILAGIGIIIFATLAAMGK